MRSLGFLRVRHGAVIAVWLSRSDRSCLQLNPVLLRRAKYDFNGSKPPATNPKEGEQLLLAILAASETLIDNRKSFWEFAADYNPVGQFFATQKPGFLSPAPSRVDLHCFRAKNLASRVHIMPKLGDSAGTGANLQELNAQIVGGHLYLRALSRRLRSGHS